MPLDAMREVYDFALEEKIKVHLDGARIWNASVATGIPTNEYGRYVDSLSVCFSKGLGAPIGSIVVGDEEFIERARRYRKIFGGGMRQVGILAAAALYALDHNVKRLKEDHLHARLFAQEVAQAKHLEIDLDSVQTNMVIADIQRSGKDQKEVLSLLKSNGILVTPERQSAIRAVMHLDVSREEVERAAAIIRSLFHG